MNDVFISYSTFDSKFAFRIYYDLVRSGLKVYLYERDGDFGIDFREEIYSEIANSEYVCLIDSPNSRNSQWVKEECLYAQELLNKSSRLKKIIPCLIEKNGDWFYQKEHYKNQTAVRGIDFSGFDYLDYKEKYKKSIALLCETLKTNFRPWSELPQDRDFEKEIALYNLSDHVKNFLINDYKNFYTASISNLETKLSRINNLIKDCSKYKVNIIVSQLAQGAIYVDYNQDVKALEVFKKLCEDFPHDARSWAAISGAQFFLSDYSASLNSIEKSIGIIKKSPDDKYLQDHLDEMIYNKIQLLLQLNQIQEASNTLLQFQSQTVRPEYLIAKIKLSILQNQPNLNLDYLKLKNNFYSFYLNSKILNRIIADLEFQLGRYFAEKSKLNIATEHYNLARTASPYNVQYHAEYFLLKKCLNLLNYDELNQILKSINFENQDELYYVGLLYFLNGNYLQSEELYNKSNKTVWGYYDKLIKYE